MGGLYDTPICEQDLGTVRQIGLVGTRSLDTYVVLGGSGLINDVDMVVVMWVTTTGIAGQIYTI